MFESSLCRPGTAFRLCIPFIVSKALGSSLLISLSLCNPKIPLSSSCWSWIQWHSSEVSSRKRDSSMSRRQANYLKLKGHINTSTNCAVPPRSEASLATWPPSPSDCRQFMLVSVPLVPVSASQFCRSQEAKICKTKHSATGRRRCERRTAIISSIRDLTTELLTVWDADARASLVQYASRECWE